MSEVLSRDGEELEINTEQESRRNDLSLIAVEYPPALAEYFDSQQYALEIEGVLGIPANKPDDRFDFLVVVTTEMPDYTVEFIDELASDKDKDMAMLACVVLPEVLKHAVAYEGLSFAELDSLRDTWVDLIDDNRKSVSELAIAKFKQQAEYLSKYDVTTSHWIIGNAFAPLSGASIS